MKSGPLLPPDWELPAVLRIRLGHGPGRQRVIEADGHLLIVLHEIPKHHQFDRIGRVFWRNPEGTWRSSIPGAGAGGLAQHLKEYTQAFDRLHEAVDDARTSKAHFEVLGQLSPIVRTTRNMYSTLQDARKLQTDDQGLLDWRDQAYELSRRAELLKSDAETSLNFEIARQSEIQSEASHQMATSAHRLNVLAAFFFPLATLSAVLGANLQHIFPTMVSPRTSLVIMLVIGVILGSGLTYLITRPAKKPKKPNSSASN